MAFIDIRTDFAFKRIFGSPQSQDLLKSLLNALLYHGEAVIQEMALRVSSPTAQLPGVQYTPLTVRATLNDGQTCGIEVQMLNLPTLGKRVFYNAAKSYGFQISRDENQREIYPLVTLNLADFILFDEQPSYVSRFAFKEVDRGFNYPNNELSLVFVELPKFTKTVEQVQNLGDAWLYLIKNAPQLDLLPPAITQVPELQKAAELALEERLNREEFDVLQQELFFIADQRRSLSFGREEGLQEGIQAGKHQGIQEGLKKGREEGIQEGIKRGREEGFQEGIKQGQQKGVQQGRTEGIQMGQLGIVLRLLTRRFGKLEPPIQAKIQELSSEQLEALAEAAWDFITDIELSDWLNEQF